MNSKMRIQFNDDQHLNTEMKNIYSHIIENIEQTKESIATTIKATVEYVRSLSINELITIIEHSSDDAFFHDKQMLSNMLLDTPAFFSDLDIYVKKEILKTAKSELARRAFLVSDINRCNQSMESMLKQCAFKYDWKYVSVPTHSESKYNYYSLVGFMILYGNAFINTRRCIAPYNNRKNIAQLFPEFLSEICGFFNMKGDNVYLDKNTESLSKQFLIDFIILASEQNKYDKQKLEDADFEKLKYMANSIWRNTMLETVQYEFSQEMRQEKFTQHKYCDEDKHEYFNVHYQDIVDYKIEKLCPKCNKPLIACYKNGFWQWMHDDVAEWSCERIQDALTQEELEKYHLTIEFINGAKPPQFEDFWFNFGLDDNFDDMV